MRYSSRIEARVTIGLLIGINRFDLTSPIRRFPVKESVLTTLKFVSRNSQRLIDNVRQAIAILVVLVLSVAPVAPALYAAPAPAKAPAHPSEDSEHDSDRNPDGCKLQSARGDIQHVI